MCLYNTRIHKIMQYANFNNIITSILLDFNINNFLTNLSFLYLFPCTRPFWERFFIQITHTSKIIHDLFYKV